MESGCLDIGADVPPFLRIATPCHNRRPIHRLAGAIELLLAVTIPL
jgi:hypothetical protein